MIRLSFRQTEIQLQTDRQTDRQKSSCERNPADMSDNRQISLHTKVSQAKCVGARVREADKRAIRQARTTKSTGRDRNTLAETEIETETKPEAKAGAKARGQANLKREQSENSRQGRREDSRQGHDKTMNEESENEERARARVRRVEEDLCSS